MNKPNNPKQESLIGASLPRPDALRKVTGAATYPGDLVREGMLHLAVVFAHRPHARILSIDSGAALAHPGVVAVLTAADVPFNAYGLIERDQPVLCADTVRFEGDKVALVVAESRAAAAAGAQLVQVAYQDLPAITDPRAAMEVEAVQIHQGHSNVLAHIPIRRGDAERALREADVVVEGEYHTTWQEHAFLQPEAGVAHIDEHGNLVLETAGQWLHEDRRQIAEILQIPEQRVIIRYASIGGAFGGREDMSIQHLAALAAWKLRRPVAIVWSREESMVGHHKRHPISLRCTWGAMRDGTIVAAKAELLADGGAYASTSVEVIKIATLLATGTYRIPNVALDGYAVYTNNIPSGAFRGFGAPQAQFASELMLARLAEALGMDALELRRKNIYREGDIEPSGDTLPAGVSALPVLEACAAEMERRMQQPRPPARPGVRRAWGFASGIKNVGYSFGYPEQATATVELHGQASVERAVVRVGAADVGQGAHLALRQIAAERLGLPLAHVQMITDDSSQAPNAGSASASRMTLMGGRAVHDACAAALTRWQEEDRPAIATAQYRPPATTPLHPITGEGRPNYCYGYVSQAVELEVNTLTGQVQVLTIISAHDVGKAINKQQVEGQIEGCLAQALGYALMEDFQVKGGKVLTPSFSTYLLPTALDMPTEIVPIILELADPNGPYGARGMSEMGLVPFAPAVADAIHRATGVWLHHQPMTPERVLRALEG
ncbi:xanthine dehydrogenase family protein [Chloroflexia bacterium SDU3-3]|nr:xanthine dehydrogenase family protein [Chloroflexia bacterium SDU3-3]